MASTRTRSQFAYIEVKKASTSWYQVSLCGPTDVLWDIQRSVKDCDTDSSGNSMKITLTGSDSTYMKLTLLEEVLKYGFVLSSNVKDDSLFLSRQIKL